MSVTWTDELTEIRKELGTDEIRKRANDLPSYSRFNTLASFYGTEYGNGATPKQMKAWATFAETLGDDVLITQGSVQREKLFDDLAYEVCKKELATRASK